MTCTVAGWGEGAGVLEKDGVPLVLRERLREPDCVPSDEDALGVGSTLREKLMDDVSVADSETVGA